MPRLTRRLSTLLLPLVLAALASLVSQPSAKADEAIRPLVQALADGKFDAVVDVTGGDRPKRLRAGMNCNASILAYENKNALMVPKAAVKRGDDANSGHVYVLTDKGQKKRMVKLGRLHKDRYEIRKGLKSGDKVVAANPDNPKPAATKPAATATKPAATKPASK